MAFRASEFADERGREREKDTCSDRIKEQGEGEIRGSVGIVWGISEENAPVTSKAECLLKDGYNRLTP